MGPQVPIFFVNINDRYGIKIKHKEYFLHRHVSKVALQLKEFAISTRVYICTFVAKRLL